MQPTGRTRWESRSMGTTARLTTTRGVPRRSAFLRRRLTRTLEALEKYLCSVQYRPEQSRASLTLCRCLCRHGPLRHRLLMAKRKTIDGPRRRALATNPSFHKFGFHRTPPQETGCAERACAEYRGKTIDSDPERRQCGIETLCGQYQWRSERAALFLDPFECMSNGQR